MASAVKARQSNLKNFIMRYLVIIVFLLVNACKSEDAISPDKNYIFDLAAKNILYSKWTLVSYESNKKINYDVSLEFKNEKNEKGINIVTGKSSINFYQADFVGENNKMTINNLIMTQIAGNPEARAFETDYLKRISEVTNYSITSETLVLSSAKQKMTFKINK
jgi:heat shock protein HslJ